MCNSVQFCVVMIGFHIIFIYSSKHMSQHVEGRKKMPVNIVCPERMTTIAIKEKWVSIWPPS